MDTFYSVFLVGHLKGAVQILLARIYLIMYKQIQKRTLQVTPE